MAKPRLDDPLTADQLRSLLDYDPETGAFTWKWRDTVPKWVNVRRAGKPAGCRYGGYLRIIIDSMPYMAQRLAWLYVRGTWPKDQIDHIDGIKTNNALTNLREATARQNMRNIGLRANNKTGATDILLRGPCLWRVIVRADGKNHHGGYFDSFTEAKAARDKLRERLHGAFAHTD